MSAEQEENAYTLGVQAGLWGYPLVHRVEAFPRTLEVKGIGHTSIRKFDNLKTAEDRFVVTPNNLTIDGYAILDLADGPVAIHVPKLADDRWFIVQIGDAFDDVVLNVGGSRPHVPGADLITGPDFHGGVPGGMIQVEFRTNIGFVGLRIAVHGVDDLPGALQAQEGFAIRPLPDYLRALPVIEKIADERWRTTSETVNGWRGSPASGRCSYDWALNAANTKNQVGTEVADQVVYVNTNVDADNQPLNGANTYVLHFPAAQTPPVAGMWNIAMYDDSMLFTANEIDRFSIGSTTDGVTSNPDESLTVYIQHTPSLRKIG